MRDYELELIAALVEGRLDDETEARALVDSAPKYREEYEAQRTAYLALSQVGTAALTTSERSALRRDLWTDLRAPEPAASSPWYYRWAPVAAGLFVVVGVVAVINQAGSSGDATPEAAELMTLTTTTAAVTETTGAGTVAAAEAPETADGDEQAPVTTEAVDTGGGDSAPEDTTGALSPSDEAYYSAEADRIREEAGADGDQTDGASTRSNPQACLDESGLDGFSVLGTYPAPLPSGDEGVPEDASAYIAAIPEGADVREAPIAFVNLLTCALIIIDQ